ncbi:NAD(P)H-dependent oxidoreductase [Nocardioides sp. CFH 31398]|uniref:NAD(P)H-dependent oxidoreductase n=1 Tax=Nocardioides sp. CFH 31398 TaxID=2919579 RepID=UPI001F053661|nr:NAD(P)H-dependent oxidoreductase [Nocardioides sp. CFH 31398]MCH1866306.1 NAD(P)H-dependent oxidoreductase [Nocardioides sp. CFH 31398]
MSHVLVVDGHPGRDSLCASLAASYAAGARETGADVTVLALRDLSFDPDLHTGRRVAQALEPDLVRAQRALVDADHVVVVTPVWWGSVPALLKGFLDRTLESGWAYRYRDNGLPQGLLAGRTARVVVTTDSPGWWLRVLMGDTTVRQLVRSTLRFCGLRKVRTTRIGAVHGSDETRRAAWLEEVAGLGRRDAARPARADKAVPPRRPAEGRAETSPAA